MGSLMRPLALASLAAAWMVAAPAVHAQRPAPSPAPGSGAPAVAIPDHKLDAAAKAIKEVAMVSEKYQDQIAAAPPSDRQRIAEQANAEMKKAVTDQGLSVEEYNSIVDTAQRDPVVHDKIIKRLQTQ